MSLWTPCLVSSQLTRSVLSVNTIEADDGAKENMFAASYNETALNASAYSCRLPIDEQHRQKLHVFFVLSSIISVFCSVPTVILNGLVLVGIYKTRSLHTPSNFLLFGLALSDVCAGLFVMPSAFVLGLVHLHENLIPFWCGYRLFANYCFTLFSGVSVLMLTLISIDRVIALHFHLRYEAIVTNIRSKSILVIVWIAAFALSLLWFWHVKLLGWISVLVLLLCMIVCFYNNLKIFRILQHHRVRIHQQDQQLNANVEPNVEPNMNMAKRRKISRNMLWVYALFLFCYLPMIIAVTVWNLTGFDNSPTLTIIYSTAFALLFLNSILNPILYAIKMRNIRRAMCKCLPEAIRIRINVGAAETQVT